MKKQFLVVLIFGAFLGSPILAQDCESSIAVDGTLITVTVCERSTSWKGTLGGMSCDQDDTTSCSFNNIN